MKSIVPERFEVVLWHLPFVCAARLFYRVKFRILAYSKHGFLSVVMAFLGLIPSWQVTGQSYTNIYNFSAPSDGIRPIAPQSKLLLSGSNLFGTTFNDILSGSVGVGAVFKVSTNGTGFTALHQFNGRDGANPAAGLVLLSNTLYGTTSVGVSFSKGTIFQVNTDGTGFTTVYTFSASSGLLTQPNVDGANPIGDLILSGNVLYGTASQAGSSGNGTVFKINLDGSDFSVLHSFSATGRNYSNSDGIEPQGALILPGDTLYGTAKLGGSSGNGTLFSVSTNGTSFRVLHNFSALSPPPFTNQDGAYPSAGVILSGNMLYGAAPNGGSSGVSTVFSIDTNGVGYAILHSFEASSGYPFYTNKNGATPISGLVLSGNKLFGTTSSGGSVGFGTVFAINTDGTGFNNLHTFGGGYPQDGSNPKGSLIFSGSSLYGTTSYGGTFNEGTIFCVSLGASPAPQLTVVRSLDAVVLMWPDDSAGFVLKVATNLVSPIIWYSVSAVPRFINGQNVVTNPVSGNKKNFS